MIYIYIYKYTEKNICSDRVEGPAMNSPEFGIGVLK